MADILFITPNTQDSVLSESCGTLLLVTILRNKGLQADILPFFRIGDAMDFQSFLDNAAQIICREQPKIVSFYTRCDNYHIMLRIAEQIKKTMNAYVVFGGPQADMSAVDTIREIPYVDFVCCGEGENTVYPFFSSLLTGEPDLTVPGLVYRVNEQVIQNPRPEMNGDLDALPDVDYSASGLEVPSDNKEAFPVDVGRGCPFGCTYCSTKSFWGRKYRLKSPQRIVEEIKQINAKYGITFFAFEHDMFTMNRKQVIETCKLLRKLDFPVAWKCSARIDCIDKELIDIMAESGMKRLYIGIETGSARMQKIINKNLKLDGIIEMLTYIRSKGIIVTASFIYGFPEETEEDVSQTMALIAEIAKIKNVIIQTHLCAFLPGTELSRKYRSGLTPAARFSDITGTVAVEECADLIREHPTLFWHFQEYKTELRTKLEYFRFFIAVWASLQPAYQYFSEKYPRERLIDMYYDFVQANLEVIQGVNDRETYERRIQIVNNDRFAKLFEGDENYDLISDYYRMMQIRSSMELKEKVTVTDVFCFSPREIERGLRIQDYTRNLSLVTYMKGQDGTIETRIRSMK